MVDFVGPLKIANLVKRPSKVCKTPYVADVKIQSSDKTILAHTPSLGCCGLIDNGTNCKMLIKELESPKICSHRVEFVQTINNTILCVNPKMSEDLVEKLFINKLFPNDLILNNYEELNREVSFTMNNWEKSRFDFAGTCSNNKKFILEVKSVPLVNSQNISYFPDGYRKKKGDVVSPRALKHIEHLLEMCNVGYETFLVFCIQRGDSIGFKLSDDDLTYKNAVLAAEKKGVKILKIFFNWELIDNYAHVDCERIEL